MAFNTYGQWVPDYPGQPMPIWTPPANPWPQQRSAAPQQAQPIQQANAPETVTIIPIDREEDTDKWQLAPDSSQLFALRDESVIISVTRHGNALEKVYYDRRQTAPAFNPAAYATREEMTAYVDSRLAAVQRTPVYPAKQTSEVKT